MLNVEEIEKEILMLEQKDTTYAACEKLAWLYIVRDHLKEHGTTQTRTVDMIRDSEFMQAVEGKDSKEVWEIIDELMDTLKIINARLYDAILKRIQSI